MQRMLIGVLGPGEGAGQADIDDAQLVGELVAKAGWPCSPADGPPA
jgi:hypothetical protein